MGHAFNTALIDTVVRFQRSVRQKQRFNSPLARFFRTGYPQAVKIDRFLKTFDRPLALSVSMREF